MSDAREVPRRRPMIPPHHICRWIGHKREGYDAGQYLDRRGRWRDRWYTRCKRCGTTDGGEVFLPGHLEKFGIWNLRIKARRLATQWRLWWRQDCEDCGKRSVRFGRAVGDHRGCDVIPF